MFLGKTMQEITPPKHCCFCDAKPTYRYSVFLFWTESVFVNLCGKHRKMVWLHGYWKTKKMLKNG